LEKNIVTPEQLLEAVKYQEEHNLRFGDYAVKKGYMSKEAVATILIEQKRADMQFGEIAIKLNILTTEQVKEILTLQRNDHILIGEAIVKKGFVTEELLARELDLFMKDQSQYASSDISVPAGIEHPDVVRDIVALTQRMLRRIANIITKADAGIISYSEPGQNYVLIKIRLTGSVVYDYGFSAPREVSELITSGILGETVSGEARDVIADGVKEFCNIVCGNIIARMAQKGMTMDIHAPEEIANRGDGYRIVRGKKALCFTLSSAVGDVILILVGG
jgi:CheY-specific phosphatase CheX